MRPTFREPYQRWSSLLAERSGPRAPARAAARAARARAARSGGRRRSRRGSREPSARPCSASTSASVASGRARAGSSSIGQTKASHSKSTRSSQSRRSSSRDVVGAEPAPEDEVLRGRDGRDRVELQEAEPSHGLEDARRRAVEELRRGRRSAGPRPRRPPSRLGHAPSPEALRLRHRAPPPWHAAARTSAARRRASRARAWSSAHGLQADQATQPVERAVERVVERGGCPDAGLAVEGPDDELPAARSDLRSARPTIRSPQRSGST